MELIPNCMTSTVRNNMILLHVKHVAYKMLIFHKSISFGCGFFSRT